MSLQAAVPSHDAAYPWQDASWLHFRQGTATPSVPLLIYRVELHSWRRTGEGGLLTAGELAPYLIPYAKQLGATHLQLITAEAASDLPVPGTLSELQALIDGLHRAGLGVLLEGDLQDMQPERAHFWLSVCHMDGLCLTVDAAAQQDPRLPEWNALLHRDYPGILTIQSGGSPISGFDLSLAEGWQAQLLEYHHMDPLFRGGSHERLTALTDGLYHHPMLLPLSPMGNTSLLSHGFGQNLSTRLAGVRLLYLYQLTQPGKKLLTMGVEFSQVAARNPSQSLDWHLLQQPAHRQQLEYFRSAGDLYLSAPSLWEADGNPDGFRWILREDADGNTLLYLRTSPSGEPLLIALNFSGLEYRSVCVGVPQAGAWRVLLSTDEQLWGGHGKSSTGTISTTGIPQHGCPQSLFLDLAPLSGVILQPLVSPCTDRR